MDKNGISSWSVLVCLSYNFIHSSSNHSIRTYSIPISMLHSVLDAQLEQWTENNACHHAEHILVEVLQCTVKLKFKIGHGPVAVVFWCVPAEVQCYLLVPVGLLLTRGQGVFWLGSPWFTLRIYSSGFWSPRR